MRYSSPKRWQGTSDKRAKEIIGKGYAKKIKIIDLLPKEEEAKKEVKEEAKKEEEK